MRKSKKKSILLIVLVLLITFIAFIGGGSFSRYITQVDGTSVMEVAKWAFSVNGETESLGTINLLDTLNAETIDEGKIAPGTSGSFDVEVDATGAAVGVEYEVSFPREGDGPKNFIYTANGHKSKTLAGLEEYLKGTIDANDTNKKRTITIGWEWPFMPETDDEEEVKESNAKDTYDGEHLYQFEFDVVVAGKQVQPRV